MTFALQQLVQLVTSVIGAFVDFIFTTDYPGFTFTIGAVLLGMILIDLGFNYLDYFLHSSGSHVRENK